MGKWHTRWAEAGEADLSSSPQRSPGQTPVDIEDRSEQIRRHRKVGPVTLSGLLAAAGTEVPASTVHRVLVRRGISRLRDLDVTGKHVREPAGATGTPGPASWSTSM